MELILIYISALMKMQTRLRLDSDAEMHKMLKEVRNGEESNSDSQSSSSSSGSIKSPKHKSKKDKKDKKDKKHKKDDKVLKKRSRVSNSDNESDSELNEREKQIKLMQSKRVNREEIQERKVDSWVAPSTNFWTGKPFSPRYFDILEKRKELPAWAAR